MRRVRLTYNDAFHHGMNRGINGENIFEGNQNKAFFLDFLEDAALKYKIRILAYCIMNNHYHLILQNTSGKLSDFFRYLNGSYGMYYRKSVGGVGYVFQKRFKSTLIQDEEYLVQAIAYVLLNPSRAGIVKDCTQYIWSSGNHYFSKEYTGIVDTGFVEELFGSRNSFIDALNQLEGQDLPTIETRYGEYLGTVKFLEQAVEKFDRRKNLYGDEMKRVNDRFFEPVEKIIWEFERKIGYPIEEIDITRHEGKRLRGELLVRLKDLGGLTYGEINKIPPFNNLKQNSMGKVYLDSKKRLQSKKVKK